MFGLKEGWGLEELYLQDQFMKAQIVNGNEIY